MRPVRTGGRRFHQQRELRPDELGWGRIGSISHCPPSSKEKPADEGGAREPATESALGGFLRRLAGLCRPCGLTLTVSMGRACLPPKCGDVATMRIAIGSSERWRDRAEEARVVAEQIVDPMAKQSMLSMAARYDKLADDAVAHQAQIPPPKTPPVA
jgi:hypothetical protein